MRRTLLASAVLLAGYAVAAHAQGGAIKASDAAGSWDTKASVGPKDSVVVTSTMTVSADGKTWTLKYTNRDPIPVRVLAVGGDSIVTEAGPYPSMLRAGMTVTALRSVGHYKGDKMWGTFDAHYSSGDVVHGKEEGTRKK
jgi:hypothetical protein